MASSFIWIWMPLHMSTVSNCRRNKLFGLVISKHMWHQDSMKVVNVVVTKLHDDTKWIHISKQLCICVAPGRQGEPWLLDLIKGIKPCRALYGVLPWFLDVLPIYKEFDQVLKMLYPLQWRSVSWNHWQINLQKIKSEAYSNPLVFES